MLKESSSWFSLLTFTLFFSFFKGGISVIILGFLKIPKGLFALLLLLILLLKYIFKGTWPPLPIYFKKYKFHNNKKILYFSY